MLQSHCLLSPTPKGAHTCPCSSFVVVKHCMRTYSECLKEIFSFLGEGSQSTLNHCTVNGFEIAGLLNPLCSLMLYLHLFEYLQAGNGQEMRHGQIVMHPLLTKYFNDTSFILWWIMRNTLFWLLLHLKITSTVLHLLFSSGHIIKFKIIFSLCLFSAILYK